MDYQALLEEIENYFCDLLIIQYRQAPKNRALIKMLVDLVFANNLALKIKDLTVNMEESIGVQLDIVGKWLGVDRIYSGLLLDKKYFALPDYELIAGGVYYPTQGGMSDYTNFEDEGGFLDYKTLINERGTINKIGDNYFRKIIKLKAMYNSIDFTCKNIDDIIWAWSEGQVYTTWDKMEIIYNYSADYYNIMQLARYKKVLPVPTGCTLTLEEYN